ncbi:putative efflux protein, MATE family [[Clostridium] aminophilum]|uniref:Multidrug export protein MepA n=1 Tax=[Clostridium] aminophilum TaxID=1526 RepID=A0A1I0AG13_9FIRM|nr:MATE family efflux transporter [[Clostridium] aminophilum]SES93184.1 putative efflux protein, MATE family [[Clostridium] aminophilum]
MEQENKQNDFSKGSMAKNILSLAIPMTLAQLVNILYNVVDRVYIGLLPEDATLSLTGLGLCLPIISLVGAFANLFGMGGSPLSSIERGSGNNEKAEKIMGNSFGMLLGTGLLLTVILFLVHRPMLYLLGASDQTFPFAQKYLLIYMLGNVFVMTGLGMNMFINAQGFGTIGMMTVLFGAITNIILDPIFIFGMKMGVQGAALATILSQLVSTVWILKFLTGEKAILKLRKKYVFSIEPGIAKEIVTLGFSGFVMLATNSLVQMCCNSTLEAYGGDLYVGVMTVVSSVREIAQQAVHGITHSAQPVLGFNYGAEEYGRVKRGIFFTTVVTSIYAGAVWLIVWFFPDFFIRLFNREPELIAAAIPAIRMYFFGYIFMALQMSGQSVAVGLGRSRQAIFFSLFRKVMIVVPLTLLLPGAFGMGTDGVFAAEPISNLLGGAACYGTMLVTIWPEMTRKEKEQKQAE